MASHEEQGTGFDPGAAGHEKQGRFSVPPEMRAEIERAARDLCERRKAGESVERIPVYRFGEAEPYAYVTVT